MPEPPGAVHGRGHVAAIPINDFNSDFCALNHDGKGKINARCRCGGSGRVLDRKATREQGAPVYKICERCSGNGFSTMPSTAAYKAILTLIPDLHIRTWTRNWKPFCDALVDVCWKEERHADKEFQQSTNF